MANLAQSVSVATISDHLLRPSPLRASLALAWREIVRFARQRNRVIGTIGTPLVFWLLFGTGLSRSFQMSAAGAGGQSFLQFFFPGNLLLLLLFASIFSSISIIEDRREGFLQSVLVAPIPRWSMVLGKVLGGAAIAWLQAMLFLAVGLVMKVQASPLQLVELSALLALAAVGLTGFGFVIAWQMDSSAGFHAIMNLVLMPMWLLSGAFFPIPSWKGGAMSDYLLHGAMRVNPMTYSVAGARQLLFGGAVTPEFWQPAPLTCWLVTAAFALVTIAAATLVARRRTTGDLL